MWMWRWPALLCVAALFAACAGGTEERGMSPWSTVAWDAVQASEDDRSLRVLFTVGECTVDSDLSVDENDQQVVVTLRQQKMMASCNLIGLSAEERVPLADPLGSRPVIDGSCATKCEPANVGRVSD